MSDDVGFVEVYNYHLASRLAKMRTPVALRDIMLQPVRTGYIGQEKPIDPEKKFEHAPCGA
jgi:hypothetical protein